MVALPRVDVTCRLISLAVVNAQGTNATLTLALRASLVTVVVMSNQSTDVARISTLIHVRQQLVVLGGDGRH